MANESYTLATVDDYLSLVEVQHRTRSKFMAVLRKYLESAHEAGLSATAQIVQMSLDEAIGSQLDIIGDIVGVSRNYPFWDGSTSSIGSMNDDQYRLVIRATIARNQWDGSFKSFASAWNEIFGGQAISAVVIDNMDMSCTVQISGNFDDDIAALIAAGYIFPKPMGVSMSYAVSAQGDRTATATEYAGASLKYLTGSITITAQ